MTNKQKLFANWYVALKFNSTQAAIQAGYSERTAASQASRLLKNVNVQKLIHQKIKKALSETDRLTFEWLSDVERIQKAHLRDIMTWDKNGIRLKDSEELNDDSSYAISEIRETTSKDGRTMTVKMESKTKALELKAKYLGIANDEPPTADDESEPGEKSAEQKREELAYLLRKRGINVDEIDS